MTKNKVLICVRVSEPGPVPPGSSKVACSKCHELVWVSPSSWSITHDNPGIKVICAECALAQFATARGVQMQDITPAQLDEIAEFLERGEK